MQKKQFLILTKIIVGAEVDCITINQYIQNITVQSGCSTHNIHALFKNA